MTTPTSVTETVPDSIQAREPVTIAHLIQRERVRASIIALPDVPGSHEGTDTARRDYPRA
jgi:hypothetical protein